MSGINLVGKSVNIRAIRESSNITLTFGVAVGDGEGASVSIDYAVYGRLKQLMELIDIVAPLTDFNTFTSEGSGVFTVEKRVNLR